MKQKQDGPLRIPETLTSFVHFGVTVLVCSILLISCGGDDNPTDSKDTTRPTVVSTVPVDSDTLVAADCTLIATNHSSYDWTWIKQHARLIVDTRYALGAKRLSQRPPAQVQANEKSGQVGFDV